MYVNSDRVKTKPRDQYIVVSVEKNTCQVQKFVGSQLRARKYVVNCADILVVPHWKYTDCEDVYESDSDSDSYVVTEEQEYGHDPDTIESVQEPQSYDYSNQLIEDSTVVDSQVISSETLNNHLNNLVSDETSHNYNLRHLPKRQYYS